MPEAQRAAQDPERRARLAALGIELLQLRESLAVNGAAEPVPRANDDVTPGAGARLVLLLRDADAVLHGAHAQRLDAILAALGLGRNQIAFEPDPSLPCMALGDHPLRDQAGVRAPDLEQLGNAAAKRALWPQLRQLRRSLETGAR